MWKNLHVNIHSLADIVRALAHLIFALLLLFFSCASVYATIKAVIYAHQLANKPVWLRILGL